MFWKFRKRKMPSQILLGHLAGTSGRFDLDDLVTNGDSYRYEADVVAPLMTINERYRTDEYPIGIMNPRSHEDIRALAKGLEERGL